MSIVIYRPTITRKELEGVLDCLINDELASGETVKNFEASAANLTGLKYSLAVNSATAAYHLIFKSLQIDSDSEVIIPSFFTQAPLSALLYLGGKAVLLDCEDNSLFPSIESIKAKITDKTKAIVTGHTFGFHADINALNELGIPVIEDISHAAGTEIDEIPVGRNSHFAVLSFDPNMIITTGRGGMILTNNSKSYSIMRDFRGGSENLNYEYAMTDFQAAMGISQLVRLKAFLTRRRDIAKKYHESIKMTPHKPMYSFSDKFAYQSFPVIFDSASEKTEKFWKKNGIEITKPIVKPLHSFLDLRGLDYPNSDRLSKKLYALPLYPALSKKEIEKISKLIGSFI